MSGGELLYAQRAAERLLATRRFLPGETMSPAYFNPDGVLVWASKAPRPNTYTSLAALWRDTERALGYVQKVIRERQDQIDKKEYAQDDILRLARARAVAIGQVRIELNMEMLKTARSKRRWWR